MYFGTGSCLGSYKKKYSKWKSFKHEISLQYEHVIIHINHSVQYKSEKNVLSLLSGSCLTSQEEILPERIIGARNLCRATHLPLREHRETIKFETGIAEPENREK